MERWLHTPRRPDAPGIYTFGHTPKPPLDPNRVSDRKLLGQAVLSLIGAWLAYSLFAHYLYLNNVWLKPLDWLGLMPHAPVWTWTSGQVQALNTGVYLYTAVWVALIAIVFVRAGHLVELVRRYLLPVARRYLLPWLRRMRTITDSDQQEGGEDKLTDPIEWPELRAAGQHTAADRLAADLRAGQMTDVDHTRIREAWARATASQAGLAAFTTAVVRHGAAAFTHPSGSRDLPVRVATHDVMASQVRIGLAADDQRNPYEHRGAAIALDPAVLGTSLLAVGPTRAGKTTGLVRPIVEALSLKALTGTAAVVAVAAAGTDLGPDHAFDVVISPGDPTSAYGLDLYGGVTDPDQAAALLAEALIGDAEPGTRRGTTALTQLLGPYHAAHGRFPRIPELRELLEGTPAAYGALRTALDEAGKPGHARDLDARQRQADRPGDIAAPLADRLALLDRPAFAGSFDTTGSAGSTQPFSPQALTHPLRVRIDLPMHGHTEAARVLARLLLAHFTAAVTTRPDHSPFACLVLDDATDTITATSIQALQRLRSANAGVALTLRALDDVPQQLRSALLSAVGCHAALAGVTTWDGKHFAEAWGTTWVETRDVTHTPDQSQGLLRRTTRGIRRLATGEKVTTESVTVRKVERERWSASDLAHSLPPGHAVLSLTSTDGRHTPPLLVNLRA